MNDYINYDQQHSEQHMTRLPPRMPRVKDTPDLLSDSFLSDFLKDENSRLENHTQMFPQFNQEQKSVIQTRHKKSRNSGIRGSVKQINAQLFNTSDLVLTPKQSHVATSLQQFSSTNGFHESTQMNSVRINSKLITNSSNNNNECSTLWNFRNSSKVQDEQSAFEQQRKSTHVLDSIRSRIKDNLSKIDNSQANMSQTIKHSPTKDDKDFMRRTTSIFTKLFKQSPQQKKLPAILPKVSIPTQNDQAIRHLVIMQYKEMRQHQLQLRKCRELLSKGILKVALKHYQLFQEWKQPQVEILVPTKLLSHSHSRQIKVITNISQQAVKKPVRKLMINTLVEGKDLVKAIQSQKATGKRYADFLPVDKRTKLKVKKCAKPV